MEPHGLAGISILKRLRIQVREDISQQLFEVVAAMRQTIAEIINLATALVNQLHKSRFLRRLRQDLNQKPSAALQGLTADPFADEHPDGVCSECIR